VARCPRWVPTVAGVTSRAAWGARAWSLRGGAGVAMSAGHRLCIGGRWRWGGRRSEGEGGLWHGLASGYPPPPRCQAKMTRGRDFRIPGLQREIPSRSFPPSWSVCKRNKRERGMERARVAWPKFKFKFESD
jgi:hypothetical protein